MSEKLTHVTSRGEVRMVDVSGKPPTARRAVASGFVRMSPRTAQMIEENRAAKGDVLAAARIAGIMAAKQTSSLIPLTHPIALTSTTIELGVESDGVRIRAQAECVGPTGVEMEALTAVSVAALTIYDMCKAVDRGMTIERVRLERKEGGRSGTWVRPDDMASS